VVRCARHHGHLQPLCPQHRHHLRYRGAGYAYASFYRPRAAYRFTCEDSIYLDPSATGRGLGKAMLTELLAQSAAFGFKQMLAVITADTANSIAIHEKFGFERVGYYKAVGYKFDRWHDIVHLQKTL
jgi:L-amino acid N-acyltransferase YncA